MVGAKKWKCSADVAKTEAKGRTPLLVGHVTEEMRGGMNWSWVSAGFVILAWGVAFANTRALLLPASVMQLTQWRREGFPM